MRTSRLVKLLIVAAALLAVLAPAASAWTSNGPLTFTASTGLVANPTFTIAGPFGGTITCGAVVGASLSGPMAGPTGPASGTWNVATLTPTFSGCVFFPPPGTPPPPPPNVPVSITCQPAQLVATSYSAPVVTGELRNFVCRVTSAAGCVATIAGNGVSGRATAVTYSNSTGQLRLANTGQTISAYPSQPCALFPTPLAVTLTAVGGFNLTYTTTTTPTPNITNP